MNKGYFIGFALLLFNFVACSNKYQLKEDIIQQEVEANVEKYKAKRRAECMVAAMDSANKIVDSLIIVKMTAYDTSLLRRPLKPIKPIIKSPLDTTPVQPILPK